MRSEARNKARMDVAERLRTAREKAGYATAADAVRAFGWKESTYFGHENGSRGLRPEVAKKYARAFRVPSAWLLYGVTSPEAEASLPAMRLIRVVGKVQAGAWAEEGETFEEYDVPADIPGYERAALFGFAVVGRSMDRHYPDGYVVVVCPAAEAGVRVGDHVVVRRTKGGFTETTVKDLQIGEGGRIELWPRSNDAAHQTPLIYHADRDESVQDGMTIIGVVVGSYLARRPGSGPIIDF